MSDEPDYTSGSTMTLGLRWRRQWETLQIVSLLTAESFCSGSVVYGDARLKQQRWKVSAELFFGQDLSPFSGDGGGLLHRDLTWVCRKWQRWPFDSKDLSWSGGDRPGGLREVVHLLLLCCSGDSLSSGFSVEVKALQWHISILVCCSAEESLLEVTAWPTIA